MMQDIATVFWRDWVVLRRRLIKFILSRMVAPVLYMVAFGWGLARSVNTGGGSYLDFIMPGILALNSMNIAFNSLTPLCAEKIYHKSLEEYLLAPLQASSFIIGKVLAAVLRGFISSAIIVVLAWLFGAHLTITVAFIGILALNCVIFAEAGFCAALVVNTFEDMARFNTYLLLPMSFLCGTFFKTDRLPELAEFIIGLLPLTHTSSLLRAINSGGEISLVSVAVLFLYAAILYALCLYIFKGLKK